MRVGIVFLLLVFVLAVSPVYGQWEENKKEVTVGEMGFSLTLPESWSVVPDEDGFKGFSILDKEILCCPVLIEDDTGTISIFVYATKHDDFNRTVMDMGRNMAEVESDVLEIGLDAGGSIYDVDENEYNALRNLTLVNKSELAYGVLFHRDGIRYEFYYSPWAAVEFGEHFGRFVDVLGTLRFTE